MRCGFVAGCPKSASSSPLPDFGRALLFFRGFDEGQVALIACVVFLVECGLWKQSTGGRRVIFVIAVVVFVLLFPLLLLVEGRNLVTIGSVGGLSSFVWRGIKHHC